MPGLASRWRAGWTVIALAVLPVAVFLKEAVSLAVFYKHDIQDYFVPYHVVVARLVAHGEAPLWNPYAFSGLPLLGDGQTAMFYPPNWVFLLLPPGLAMSWDVILQFSIAGVGCWLFARSLELGRLPSSVAAMAYMFGGFLTARVVHLSILSGAAIVPLTFFCVERLLRTRQPRWFVAASGAVAMQMMAGHPQVPAYTAVALALYAVVRGVERRATGGTWRSCFAAPLQLVGVYLFGALLAAVQLVPWAELARQSPRAAGASFDFVFSGSMFGGQWLLFLFPYLRGSLAPGPYGADPMNIYVASDTWEHSAYVGMLPLALAAVGLLGLFAWGNQDAQRRRWFSSLYFGLLLAVSLVAAAGLHTPFAHVIYATPILGKLRQVERTLVLAAFAGAMLAASGLQQLIEAPPSRRALALRAGAPVAAILLACAPLGVVFLARHPGIQAAWRLTPAEVANLSLSRPNAYVPVVTALAGALWLLWASWRGVGTAARMVAAGMILVDMAAYAAAFNPSTDPRIYDEQPAALALLRQEREPFRKATFLDGTNDLSARDGRETLALSWGMLYGVEDVNGFNSLQPRRYTDFLFGADVEDVSYGYLRDDRLFRPESPALSALNVKYLFVPAGSRPDVGPSYRQVFENDAVRVYENTQAYPRAYFVDSVRTEGDPAAILREVTADGFDGRRQALVEAPERPPVSTVSASATATVSFTQYTPARMALAASTSEPRFLVLSEMDSPGWRAYVDGVETPIYRTNYLFRGVTVPAGAHTVTFIYRPASAIAGVAISCAALVVAAALLVAGRRHIFGQSQPNAPPVTKP